MSRTIKQTARLGQEAARSYLSAAKASATPGTGYFNQRMYTLAAEPIETAYSEGRISFDQRCEARARLDRAAHGFRTYPSSEAQREAEQAAYAALEAELSGAVA